MRRSSQRALDRLYRLAVSLPDAPLERFHAKTAALPRTTEAERLVIQRIGQNVFRDALMDYWGGAARSPESPSPGCSALRTLCPGRNATTCNASTSTTAFCCRPCGTRPLIRASLASLMMACRAPIPSSVRLRARPWASTQRRRFVAFKMRITCVYRLLREGVSVQVRQPDGSSSNRMDDEAHRIGPPLVEVTLDPELGGEQEVVRGRVRPVDHGDPFGLGRTHGGPLCDAARAREPRQKTQSQRGASTDRCHRTYWGS